MWQWAHLLGFNLYWVLAVKWQQPGPLLALLLLHFLFSPRRWQDWRLIPVALAGCSTSCSGGSACFTFRPVFRSGWCCSGAVLP